MIARGHACRKTECASSARLCAISAPQNRGTNEVEGSGCQRPCELQNSARTELDSRGVRPRCDEGSCFGQRCGQSFHTDPTHHNPALSKQTRPCRSEGVRRASKLPRCASLTRFSVFTLAGGVGCRHPIPAASCEPPDFDTSTPWWTMDNKEAPD